MSRMATFDYYYGMQAEAYSFYRIPKILFTDPFFKKLSCEAKVLYGLMLDRMALSVKNKWFDEQDRVYIIFTIDDARELMGCCKQTAVNLLAELDTNKGIGLIEKKRLGLGKANIIYVKNFMLREESDAAGTPDSSLKSKKQTSGSPENRLQEVQKADFRKSENQTSESPENGLQEVCETDRNNTDINKTDVKETDTNQTEWSDTQSDQSAMDRSGMDERSDEDEIEIYYAYQDLVKENIEYDILCQTYQKEDVDGLVALMVDTICSKRKRVVIGGEPVPVEIVKSRLLKLNMMHVQYVFECMKKNTTKVRNIKQYLLAALYNAPSTIGHYYSAEVNHDLYGAWREED